MKTYHLSELVALAKNRSPFYQKLYQKINISDFKLSDLPIIDEKAFWDANSYHNNQIITDPFMHGILVRSGGTTGIPKVSVFAADEWHTFCKIIAEKLREENLLKHGDCVANMYVYGSLYGSFLLMSEVLLESSFRILELPMGTGKQLDIPNSVELIKELKANVVMGMPLFLMAFALYVRSHRIKGIKIDRLLYGADILLESQYRYLQEVFPEAVISSSTYASSDSGYLGYADATCQINEYRSDNRYTIMEIVDEKGRVIEEPHVTGRLIITNLTKALMPVIRYPAGDLAFWCESKENKFRKFRLAGRQTTRDNLLSLGSRSLTYQEVYDILEKSKNCRNILGFQVRIGKKIRIEIASDVEDEKKLHAAKKEIKQLISESIPDADMDLVEIEFLPFSELKFTAAAKMIKLFKE
jgi:phenylacetate-CoA ligase